MTSKYATLTLSEADKILESHRKDCWAKHREETSPAIKMMLLKKIHRIESDLRKIREAQNVIMRLYIFTDK